MKNKFKPFISFAIITLFIGFNSNLKAQDYPSVDELKGLEVGSQAPGFEAKDNQGNSFSLEDQLKKSPVILVFYRGQWCPICNRHLSSIQDSLDLIKKSGAKIVAISPEKPELSKKMAKKTAAEYTILYDKDYKIGTAYDVIFLPEEKIANIYDSKLNADLKNAHSDGSKRLPIPATYIIGQDGKIIWRHFDPDYKNRSSVKEMLKVLNQ